MKGAPSFKTNVGVKVMRGRLPGATTLGLFGSVKADCRRCPIKTPVSPATTAGNHAPLGVALNMLPSLSMTLTQVVSLAFRLSRIGSAFCEIVVAEARRGFMFIGSPGR